jgi:hypothetical protein
MAAEKAGQSRAVRKESAHQIARAAGGAQPRADQQKRGKGVQEKVRVAEVSPDVDLHQQAQVVQAARGADQPIQIG